MNVSQTFRPGLTITMVTGDSYAQDLTLIPAVLFVWVF